MKLPPTSSARIRESACGSVCETVRGRHWPPARPDTQPAGAAVLATRMREVTILVLPASSRMAIRRR